jgi:LuxR family maltose regulon positive regulatory protein
VETPLLHTKLYIPQIPSNHVARPHLIQKLNQGLKGKLILVAAPAGFGKTSLLSEWVRQLAQRIAWLSLDKDDNDLARFLSYIIAGLQEVDERIGLELQALVQASQPPPAEMLLAMLVNEIDAIEDDFFLVLDDYQDITAPEIHHALNFMLDHAPPQMHLVIASRADPFLPIPRFRARGSLLELRADDVRFTTQETTAFLNQVTGLDLSRDHIASLQKRTEGWIAGLHLAALTMKDMEDPAQFISTLISDDRYIIDYLVDEVLAQRPSGTKDFLLKTSILERMNAQLCDTVTGENDGKKMLSALDQANLFIVPLDNRRHWYRYHRLFADLLRQRLEESYPPSEITSLHQLASRWYEENNYLFESIEHSLAAEDYENAIRLIEQGTEQIFATSQLVSLTRIWDQIPQEHLLNQPKLCVVFSWAWLATGHPEITEECLKLVERSFGAEVSDLSSKKDAEELTSPETHGALVEVAVIRSQVAINLGDFEEALKLALLVHPLLDDEKGAYLHNPPVASRTVVNFSLGLAHEFSGELEAAENALTEALVLGKEQGNIHIVAVAYGHLAKIHRIRGHIQSAMRLCIQGISDLTEMAGGRTPMSGLLLSELGLIQYEHNDLKSAQDSFQEAINVAKPWAFWEGLLPAYSGQARVKQAQGDKLGAFEVLDELESLSKNSPERVSPIVASSRARLWAAEGNLTAAMDWVHAVGMDVDDEISYPQEGNFIIFARVLIAAKRWDEADRLVGRLVTAAETGKRNGRLIELLVLRAFLLEAQSKRGGALKVITQALKLGEPNGYIRTFLDEGAPMLELLSHALSRGIESEFVEVLLRAFNGETIDKGRGTTDEDSSIIIPPSSLVEPLSERELDVLRMLKTELSGPDIAHELSIALSTMRTHTQNIFGKLNVSNRRAAVRRAEELELL